MSPLPPRRRAFIPPFHSSNPVGSAGAAAHLCSQQQMGKWLQLPSKSHVVAVLPSPPLRTRARTLQNTVLGGNRDAHTVNGTRLSPGRAGAIPPSHRTGGRCSFSSGSRSRAPAWEPSEKPSPVKGVASAFIDPQVTARPSIAP